MVYVFHYRNTQQQSDSNTLHHTTISSSHHRIIASSLHHHHHPHREELQLQLHQAQTTHANLRTHVQTAIKGVRETKGDASQQETKGDGQEEGGLQHTRGASVPPIPHAVSDESGSEADYQSLADEPGISMTVDQNVDHDSSEETRRESPLSAWSGDDDDDTNDWKQQQEKETLKQQQALTASIRAAGKQQQREQGEEQQQQEQQEKQQQQKQQEYHVHCDCSVQPPTPRQHASSMVDVLMVDDEHQVRHNLLYK